MRVVIYTARPGVIIGRKGVEIEKLRSEIEEIALGQEVRIDTEEVSTPETDAQIVADNIAYQIEKRIPYKRAVKRAIEQAMQAGAQGIKIEIGGRLSGAEIARTEKYRAGKVPLSTLRADIDYALSEAQTTYGTIGVKVWIYHGEGKPLKDIFREQMEMFV